MIERASIEDHPELEAFLAAQNKLDLLRANKQLNLKKLYQVRQKRPLDLVACHPAVYIIAAFGTVEQMKYFLLHQYDNKVPCELIFPLALYAVRNLNQPIYQLFYKEYGLKTSLEMLAETIDEPITIRNKLTELLDAAAMAGNEEVVEFILSMDRTGYIALGVQGNIAPKFTPLHYAAIGNHLILFDRLLSVSTVKDQFERCYTAFCLLIEAPSSELKQRFLSLKPASHASSTCVSLYFSSKKIVDGQSEKQRATDVENMQETSSTKSAPSIADTESLSYSISRFPSGVYLSQYTSDDENQSQIGMMIDDDEIGSPFSAKSQKPI